MKLTETMLNTLVEKELSNQTNVDIIGDDHYSSSIDTPLTKDAFKLSNNKKKSNYS